MTIRNPKNKSIVFVIGALLLVGCFVLILLLPGYAFYQVKAILFILGGLFLALGGMDIWEKTTKEVN